MSKAKKPSKSKPAKKPARGLGRGLSALMDDVGMSAIVDDTVQPAPKAVVRKTSKETSSKTKEKTTDTPKTKTASKAGTKPKTEASKKGASETLEEKSINYVAMDQLTRNPDQPRRHFDKALLDELTDSIVDKGVLQPILVRPLPESAKGKFKGSKKPSFQIIAGERRWQAALKAGLETIPVFIRDITDQEALEIGVVENVHRADLNPMEEALAYKSLLTQFQRTQEDVAKAVGKSRPYIANMLRLLNLPSSVQTYLAEGKISTGHARAIIAAPDPAQLADAIVDKDLSVRDAENWVRRLKQDQNQPVLDKAIKDQKSADIRNVERQLADALGLLVDLRHKGQGGELRIKYKKADQLEGLITRLMRG